MVVLDTAALIYWTLDPHRLSAKAGKAIGSSERILVSAISLWEIAIKVERKRLMLPMTPREFAALLDNVEFVEVVPVDAALWLDSVALDWDNRDPADRLIVALATKLACPLITSDAEIRRQCTSTVW